MVGAAAVVRVADRFKVREPLVVLGVTFGKAAAS
jgi:hypothetical protein